MAKYGQFLSVLCFCICATYITLTYSKSAFDTSSMSGDEASTIIASAAILKTGLPQMPSGLNYWRSPLSHYLNAVGIWVFGENEVGYSSTSLFCFGMLLLLFAWMVYRRSNVFVAMSVLLLLASFPDLRTISSSPRMYMLYTFFASLSCLLVLFQPEGKWRGWGLCYALFCILSALAHQHFVIFLPGFFICGILSARKTGFKTWIQSPQCWAPILGGIAALGIHFFENDLPNAWTNSTSNPTSLGRSANFTYTLDVIQSNLFVYWQFALTLLLLGLLIPSITTHSNQTRKLVKREWLHALTLFTLANLALSATLPAKVPYYIAPLLPLACLLLFLTSRIFSSYFPSTLKKILVAIGFLWMFLQPNPNLKALQKSVVVKPSNHSQLWLVLRSWIATNNAIVISSDPDIAFVRVGKADYEVRNHRVPAPTPCSILNSDQFNHPYIHSLCTLQQVEEMHRPILYMGLKLRFFGTAGKPVSNYIDENYLSLGEGFGMNFFCSSRETTSCFDLKENLDANKIFDDISFSS